MLSCLWDGAYKIPLSANRKVANVVAAVGFLSRYLNGPLPYVRRPITVYKRTDVTKVVVCAILSVGWCI